MRVRNKIDRIACFKFAAAFLLIIPLRVYATNYPDAITSFTGGATYCQLDAAGNLSVTFSTCRDGNNQPSSITVTWYSNTVDSNSGGTQVAQSSSSTSTVTYTFGPPTTTLGPLYYYVEITWTPSGNPSCGDAGILTSGTQAVVVNPPAPATPGPISGSATVSPNTSGLVYSISAVPNADTYDWTVPTGWTINSGQGTTSVSLTSGDLGQNGDISVTAGNSCGTSAPSTLGVIIQGQDCPVSTSVAPSGAQVLCVGDPAGELTASVTTSGGAGSPTLLYQWYYNTTNINTVAGAVRLTGETNATFTPLSTISEAGTRYYFCVGYAAGNGCDQTDSDQALASNTVEVTVNEPPTTADAGSPQTICDGSGATLAANIPAVGTAAWTVTSGPSLNLGQFSDPSSNSATFTPDGGTGDYVLQWTISNDPCTPSNSEVTITVDDVPALPVITGPAIVTQGSDYVYSITAVADATNYTWSVPTGWSIVSGQGTESITATAGSTAGDVAVYVTNTCGDGPTATLAVTVSGGPDCPVSTSVNPPDAQVLCVGDPASQLTASVTTSGGTGTPTLAYQWYYNTTNSNTVSGAVQLPGETNATFTPQTTISEAGTRYYFCVGYAADNGCGQTDADQALASNAVEVTVNEPPSTSDAGSPQTICDGSGATLSANVPTVGNGAWTVTSGPSTNLSQFSDPLNNTTTFTPDGGTGDYVLRWTISNDPCTPSTSEVTITVDDVPALPVITGPTTVTSGSDYVYSITAVPDATDYTWSVPGTWTLVSGQGTESITATAGSSGGDVAVYVSNTCGDGPTATLAVTVSGGSDCPVSTSVAPSGAQLLCVGDPAGQLTASITTSGGTGTPTLLYQWYYNTTNSNTVSGAVTLTGETSATFTPQSTVSEAGTRYYFCVGYAADNGCGQTDADQALASNAVEVSVTPAPATPGLIFGTADVPENTSGLTYGIVEVAGATSYTWTVPTGWAITSGQGTASIVVTSGSAGQNGDITVTASNACGTSGASTLAVTSSTPADHSVYGCNACHITHDSPGGALTSTLGNANLCLSCHVTTGAASAKPFSNADKAIPGVSGNSHAWDVASVNATYETVLTTDPDMLLRVDGGNIVCSTCHNQHNSNTNPSYTRISNSGDAMCKDCHAPRNVGRYADAPATNKGSHPVGISYSGTGDLEPSPTGSAILVGGNIECSSCHMTHYAPTSDGTLLRQTNDDALCTSCHALGTHNGMSCSDCHISHNPNKSNIYMIRNTIATPNSGSKTVVFTALTGANSFADGDATYDGICEVCHTTTLHYQNDGNASDQNHSSVGGADGTNCTGCHPHNSNFSPAGGSCDDCHNAQAPTFSLAVHVKHKDRYGYACNTCHYQYGSGGALESTHPSGTIDVNFDPGGMATRNGQDAITPVMNGDNTCDNIYCHSDGRSAYRGTDGTYIWSGDTGPQTATYSTTPAWGSGTITTCDGCHSGAGNMTDPYTITAPGPADPAPPPTGSHRRGAHVSNSQELSGNGWAEVNCFWCHNASNGDDGSPIFQGTYGTSFHVDGETYFDPRSVVDGGTMVNSDVGGSFSYSYFGSSGHCGDGKTCW